MATQTEAENDMIIGQENTDLQTPVQTQQIQEARFVM